MTDQALELDLKLAEVRAKQGKPAGPSTRRAKGAAPAGPDMASRAAGDYDAEDLEPAAPEIPAHLRQYLVNPPPPAGDSRLERSRRQIGGTKDHPIPIGNEHGWMGCDWAGLARMAAARARANLPVDDLDAEALSRAGWVPTDGTWTPPPAESS